MPTGSIIDSPESERRAGWFLRLLGAVAAVSGAIAVWQGIDTATITPIASGVGSMVAGAVVVRWSWSHRASERSRTRG